MIQIGLNAAQLDCLQQFMHVLLEKASSTLARFLRTSVHFHTPFISETTSTEAPNYFLSSRNCVSMAVVSQGFSCEQGLRGEILMRYELQQENAIANLLGYSQAEVSEIETINDISALFATTLMNSFSQHINHQISYSTPRVLYLTSQVSSSTLSSSSPTPESMLKIELEYQICGAMFNCKMYMLIPAAAFEALRKVLNASLGVTQC